MLLMRRPKSDYSVPAWYAMWSLLMIIFFFAALTRFYPIVGLTGVGLLAILMGVFVEMNAGKVWQDYIKSAKKFRRNSFWQRPNKVYYALNVALLWPMVILLGAAAIWAACAIS